MWAELSASRFYNSHHCKLALKIIFKGEYFQFPEAVVTSTMNESSTDAVQYKFWLFYRSSNCSEQL